MKMIALKELWEAYQGLQAAELKAVMSLQEACRGEDFMVELERVFSLVEVARVRLLTAASSPLLEGDLRRVKQLALVHGADGDELGILGQSIYDALPGLKED